MIISKDSLSNKKEEKKDDVIIESTEYDVNPLVGIYTAVKTILGDLKRDEDNPNSPPLFYSIKMNNGQLTRIKNNLHNTEYALRFPAVFMHFIDVRYLVSESRIGEGRATLRIQYVLNRLNNSDAGYELEGYKIYERINKAIQTRKNEFPDLTERFQLEYFDQLESLDDGLQPFWIDYEVWFKDYTAWKEKNYVSRYVVMPPFTNHSDQTDTVNPEHSEDYKTPTIEDSVKFQEHS